MAKDVYKRQVTDEDIDNELKARAKRNARMVTVDRPAKEGDTVLIDYEGWVGDCLLYTSRCV